MLTPGHKRQGTLVVELLLELPAQPIQIGKHKRVIDAIDQKFETKRLSRFERDHVAVKTVPVPQFRQGPLWFTLDRKESTLRSNSVCHDRRREKSDPFYIERLSRRGVEQVVSSSEVINHGSAGS